MERIDTIRAELESKVGFYLGELYTDASEEFGLIFTRACRHGDCEGVINNFCKSKTGHYYASAWVFDRQFEDHLSEDIEQADDIEVYERVFTDDSGREYRCTNDVISLAPLEVFGAGKPFPGGQVFYGAGTAVFESMNGRFFVRLPDGTKIYLDTRNYRNEDCAYITYA